MLFETQPNMKRTFRQYRGKKHSELRINEDLQCTIMYLMSILKRLVRIRAQSFTSLMADLCQAINRVSLFRAMEQFFEGFWPDHLPTSLMADLCQEINGVSLFRRCPINISLKELLR